MKVLKDFDGNNIICVNCGALLTTTNAYPHPATRWCSECAENYVAEDEVGCGSREY
jgi:hypothetical protein